MTPLDTSAFDNISLDDYVFIIDASGDLKAIMIPEEFENQEIPASVKKIMAMFGISTIKTQILH